MTKSQTLSVRLSEIRQRLNTILVLEGDAFTDEIRQESDRLAAEHRTAETQYRSALTVEAAEAEHRAAELANGGAAVETAEHRERRELRGRARLSRYMAAAIDGTVLAGAEDELSAAEECRGLVPLSLWGGTAEERMSEWRAARAGRLEHRAVTPGVGTSDADRTQAPVVPALFDRSVAPYLGIEMPTAAVGVASYPVLSTSLTAGVVAASAAGAETAGSFTVASADPRRLTGALRIRREDAAKLADLESSLRMNLSMVLSDTFDGQLVNGDNIAPNLDGVLRQLTDPAAPAAAAETFARYVAAFASHVDGLYATTLADVRALVGPQTYRHAAGVFRAAEDSMTAEAWIQDRTGGMRVTRRIADPASNIQQAIIRRTNPAGDRVAVAPVWGGVELIRDPYTAAGKGEIVVTAIMLVGGVVMLREDVFVQDSFRLA